MSEEQEQQPVDMAAMLQAMMMNAENVENLSGEEGQEGQEQQQFIDADPATSTAPPYQFEKTNPYLGHENPVEEGLKLWNDEGKLTGASLAFEAAVQKDEKDSKAWTYLGKVQAENEKEEAAILALHRAVNEDHGNLEALMVGLSAWRQQLLG
jgi:peroxin-5